MGRGISRLGDPAETILVKKHPSILALSKGNVNGDIFKEIDGVRAFAEVKDGHINQSRPAKGIVLIYRKDGVWYVIPPWVLIDECLKQDGTLRRGQHTPDPLRCSNSLRKSIVQSYVVSFDKIPTVWNTYEREWRSEKYSSYRTLLVWHSKTEKSFLQEEEKRIRALHTGIQ